MNQAALLTAGYYHYCLVLYGLSQKLVFVPVASAMSGARALKGSSSTL